jgi:hypothetical protein
MLARWNPTPRDLLVLGLILGAIAVIAVVFVFLAAIGATSDSLGAVIFELLIAGFLVPMAVYLFGVSRTTARASDVADARVLAVAVGRKPGRFVYPAGQVFAATETAVVVLRSRLIGSPTVLKAVPYRAVSHAEASWDDVSIESNEGVLALDAVAPTQGKLFAALVSSRAGLSVDAEAFASPLS